MTTAWSKVYAVNAKTGKEMWQYDPKVPGGRNECCSDVDSRGVAVYRGKVFLGDQRRAIDCAGREARNGTPDGQTTPLILHLHITGAPRVAAELGFHRQFRSRPRRSWLCERLQCRTGKLVWRFYTVPGDPKGPPDGAASDEVLKKLAAPTWFGDWYKLGGGGHVWNSLVFDPDFNQLYLATGNGFPWNPNLRSQGKGDNLFIASIVAVDADTGRYKWHYQESPGEGWDYDAISDMVLTELAVTGDDGRLSFIRPRMDSCMCSTGKQASCCRRILM